MGFGSFLKETFSLKNIFKFAVISVPVFLVLGAVDLAVWHYLPGGMELFSVIKEPLLNNPIAVGMSNMFNSIATMLGGGAAITAAKMGGIATAAGEFVPEY